jgi:hypothetical protein
MSSIWRYLPVDDHQSVGDEMYNFLLTQLDSLPPRPSTTSYYFGLNVSHTLKNCPLLAKFLSGQQLNPLVIAIVICNNQNKLELHIDLDGADPYVRILWPVRNCQGSKTQFWRVPEGSGKFVSDNNGVLFTDFPLDQERELIDEFELIAPLVMDASVPHSADPNPDFEGDRISLIIGFDRDLPISKSVKAWFGFER